MVYLIRDLEARIDFQFPIGFSPTGGLGGGGGCTTFQFPIGFSHNCSSGCNFTIHNFQFPIGFSLGRATGNTTLTPYTFNSLSDSHTVVANHMVIKFFAFNSLSDSHTSELTEQLLRLKLLSIPYRILTRHTLVHLAMVRLFQFPIGFSLQL